MIKDHSTPGEQLNGGRLNIRQISEYILIAQAAAEIGKHQTDTEQKAEVADTVDQKGFRLAKVALGRLK